MSTTSARSEFPHFERKLRIRKGILRLEIQAVLLRTDSERYARIAGEVHDVEEEALADLLVDLNLAEITRGVEEIRDIDAALLRIRDGTYGTCVACRQPIDRARLDAYATAKRCLACQQLHERTRAVPTPHSL